jgi:hypothetical protein
MFARCGLFRITEILVLNDFFHCKRESAYKRIVGSFFINLIHKQCGKQYAANVEQRGEGEDSIWGWRGCSFS